MKHSEFLWSIYLTGTLFLLTGISTPTYAQSLDLTVKNSGLSIGDSRTTNGVRLNFRDRRMEQTNGINLTLWQPFQPARGIVNGLALGVPLTGARSIHGLGIGIGGVAAEEHLHGIIIGGLGAGAGEELVGIGLGGLGLGSGGNVTGLMIGGLGVGAGGDVTGVMIGGLGAGAGGNAKGILMGGLGVGSGNDLAGIGLGGLGAGAGGNVKGIFAGGLGVGAGGDFTGIAIGGIGVGAGGTLTGIGFGGVGVGATRVRGITLSVIAAGSSEFQGLNISPAYFKIEKEGVMTGFSVSAFNHIRGSQQGLTIGIFNYANELQGLQLGILNYAGNNKRGLQWLPVVNAHFD